MRLPTYQYIYEPNPINLGQHLLLPMNHVVNFYKHIAIAPPSKSIIDTYRQMIEPVPLSHSFIVPIYYPINGHSPWVSLGIRGKTKRGEDPLDAIRREGFEEFGYIPSDFRQTATIVDSSPRRTTYMYLSTVDQVSRPQLISNDQQKLFNDSPDDYSRRVIWLIHGTTEQLFTIAEQPRLFPCSDNIEQIIGFALISRFKFQQIINDFRLMHNNHHVGLLTH